MQKEEIVNEIKKQIKEKVRPALVMDGGNIEEVSDETFNAASIVHAYELAVSHFVLVKKMHRENIDVISVKKVLR